MGHTDNKTIMFTKGKRIKKKGIRLFIVAWWKGRSFYFAQQEECDGEGTDRSEIIGLEETAKRSVPSVPQGGRVPPQLKRQHLRHPKTRSLTVNSFQDSIESMDSLAESHWEPEEDKSQSTTTISNTVNQTDFLDEHLGFLSAQTQPREVEVVYHD